MPRKLAPEALYSNEQYGQHHPRGGDWNVTAEHIEKVDPGGLRTLALLKEMDKQKDEK